MKVKCFYGDNLPEALAQVKAEMGSDAVIVKINKQRKKGFLGFFMPPGVEVIAAVDNKKHEVTVNTAFKETEKAGGNIDKLYQDPANEHSDYRAVGALREESVSNQISEIKSLLQEQFSAKQSQNMVYPKAFQYLFEDLLARDVDEKLAREIIDQALHQVKQPLWDDQRAVEEAVLGIITEYIYRFQRGPVGEKGRIALIGPTGVGKTTTIAKLASIFSVIDEKRVALITLDTFRVGAVGQLKTYADIISIPIEVAHTPQELRALLVKHDDKGIVLIDTAGKSPYNKLEIAKTKGFLDACPGVDVYLVLSAAANRKDMAETVNRYSQMNITNLIFTKLDETNSYGNVLNIINEYKQGVAYITTGQDVPNDIEAPAPEKIAKLILQGREHLGGSSERFAFNG